MEQSSKHETNTTRMHGWFATTEKKMEIAREKFHGFMIFASYGIHRAHKATCAAFLILLFVVCHPDMQAQSSTRPGHNITLRVDGIACPFCSYSLEQRLQHLEGVDSVRISIDHGTVVVSVAGDRDLTDPQLQEAVKRSGFTLRGIQRQPRTRPR